MEVVLLVVSSVAAGFYWAYHNYTQLKTINLHHKKIGLQMEEELSHINSQGSSEPHEAVEIGNIIHEGASEFILSEYKICSVFVALMATLVWLCVDGLGAPFAAFTFLVGAATSMCCGAFGMHIATFSNYRTTLSATDSLGAAFKVAYRAGVIIGFVLVSLSLIVLLVVIYLYQYLLGLEDTSEKHNYYEAMFESIAGFGLGGSTVALFARVGGGIFTKAADLGADLVGKVLSGLPEDSPRNPATIADNVGDNVGDIAGMGADLFGSFAESTCAALIVGGTSITTLTGVTSLDLILFVLAVPAVGILVSLGVSALITETDNITASGEVERSLKKQLIYSTVLLIPALWLAATTLIGEFKYISGGVSHTKSSMDVFLCLTLGLVGGLIIGYVT